MTRRLPHVGLDGRSGSLYGDRSTIGAQGRAERDALLDAMARALLTPRPERDAAEPIRVQAWVGEAIPELTSDA